MNKFHHMYLVCRNRREVRRFLRHIAACEGQAEIEVDIRHNEDGCCCRHESWQATLSALLAMRQPGYRAPRRRIY